MPAVDYQILEVLERVLYQIEAEVAQLVKLNATLSRIEAAMEVPITGIALRQSGPLTKETTAMALSSDPIVTSLTALDTDTYLLTVEGTDGGTPPVISDISLVATVAMSVDNPAIASVDAPIGVTAVLHGLTVGSFNLTVVATWNDGSQGPYTVVYPGTCAAKPGQPGIVLTMSAPQ